MKAMRVLTRRQDFSLVLEKGRSKAGRVVVVKVLANGLDEVRYGLVASKKVGGAVVRNRARRRLREVLRRIEIRPGWDVVFIIRRAIDAAEFSAIEKEVRTLLDSIRLLLDDNEKDCPGLS